MEYPPADKGEHGEVVSREPFKATRNTSGRITTTYASDISFERRWTDGFIDYACQTCGKAFLTPKGVGSHSQHHPQHPQPAWKRSDHLERQAAKPVSLEWEEPPMEAEAVDEWREDPVTAKHVEVAAPAATMPILTNATDSFILGQIAALIAPDLIARIDVLEAENQQLKTRLEEVEGEFDALIELAASRRRKPDGG